MDELPTDIEALFYDSAVPDWPGELDFYRALAAEAHARGHSVLEIASGTGRVTLPLAQLGLSITGLDLSSAMLKVARPKSAGQPNVRWAEGDMRTFALEERFGLIISPGHSFQFMLTPADQVACLNNLRRHLAPGGVLVVHLDHQDMAWLGSLPRQTPALEPGQRFAHPQTGRTVQPWRAWSYDPATQTATVVGAWEELGPEGAVIQRWKRAPRPLHCVFRFEMEHLLARAGFEVKAVYGDFFRGELRADSSEMIWVASVADLKRS